MDFCKLYLFSKFPTAWILLRDEGAWVRLQWVSLLSAPSVKVWCLAGEMLAENVQYFFCGQHSFFCNTCIAFWFLSHGSSTAVSSGVSLNSPKEQGRGWRWVDPCPAPRCQFMLSFIYRAHVSITQTQLFRAFHPALQLCISLLVSQLSARTGYGWGLEIQTLLVCTKQQLLPPSFPPAFPTKTSQKPHPFQWWTSLQHSHVWKEENKTKLQMYCLAASLGEMRVASSGSKSASRSAPDNRQVFIHLL